MPITMDTLKSFLMEVWKNMGKVFLVLYFAIIAVLTAYLTCTLWLAAPKDSPAIQGATQTNAQQAASKETPQASAEGSVDCSDKAGDPPKITRLNPDAVAIGENYVNVAVFGCNFTPEPKVKFNGLDRSSSLVGNRELIVPLQASDFASSQHLSKESEI